MPESLSKPTLPTFSWIGYLKDDDRELLSSYGDFFPGHPGNIIIREGVMQTEVVVVISGRLEVRAKQEDGTEAVLAHVGPGETLGEVSLFNPGPATATVTAVEFSQLWRIADADLIHFMEENPGAGNVLLRTLASILAQRLRQVDPKSFGLSAYAVVDSSEVEKEPTPPAAPAPPVSATPAPAPAPPSSVKLGKSASSTNFATSAIKGKKTLSKTQSIPDPDELEPL
jgi:CRP/FNR family cyclic AMP-dependent transcriptional regulator